MVTGLFAMYQSGFRLGWSTMNSILALDLEIQRAWVNKEVVAALLLDIEKDMLWKEGLVKKICDVGVQIRMVDRFFEGQDDWRGWRGALRISGDRKC